MHDLAVISRGGILINFVPVGTIPVGSLALRAALAGVAWRGVAGRPPRATSVSLHYPHEFNCNGTEEGLGERLTGNEQDPAS